MQSLDEVLTDQIRDLYDAEKQLVKELPRMAKAASHQELRAAFKEHLEITKGHVTRLEQVFESMGVKAKGKPCKGMKGLLEEGRELRKEGYEDAQLDCALIGAAQKVEHYEISGYGTARTIAKATGKKEAAQLLDETLKEEGEADKILTRVSLQIIKESQSKESQSQGAATQETKSGRGTQSRKTGSSKGNGANGHRTRSHRNGGAGKSNKDADSSVTTDHQQIQHWAEERGAQPSCVRGTGKRGDTGLLRLDFPGYSGAESLEHISWDEFFEKFDENGLALVYQDTTAAGEKSNFNKLISRSGAQKR